MRAVIFVWMMLLGLAAAGQSNTIRGEVIDLRSEERLKHATVVNLQSKQSVLTDHQGEFVLAAAESDSITISAVGYLTDTVVISSSNKFIAVQLKPLDQERQQIWLEAYQRFYPETWFTPAKLQELYDLKTNEELIFIKENNGGTRGADSRQDDYTVYKFIKENVTVEIATYNFMSSNVKFLYKNEIFDMNGMINEKKVLEFKEKYDENISDKTVIIR